jgi:hypothetical protein
VVADGVKNEKTNKSHGLFEDTHYQRESLQSTFPQLLIKKMCIHISQFYLERRTGATIAPTLKGNIYYSSK